MTARPGSALRFLALVIGGWLVARGAVLLIPIIWPDADRGHRTMAAQGERSPPARRIAAISQAAASRSADLQARVDETGQGVTLEATVVLSDTGRPALLLPLQSARDEARDELGDTRRVLDDGLDPDSPVMELDNRASPNVRERSPWSLTGWLLWRPDLGASLATEPLLGGSQAGLRVDYRLWSRGGRMIGLYGRFARAFERPFAEEAALGLAARPFARLPLSLIVERRQALGRGARSAFAVMAAGGIGPARLGPGKLAARIEVEAYAQAGWVGPSDPDRFADGRLGLGYRLMDKRPDRPGLLLGIAVSGGAQSGASRLDIGPELRLTLPVANGHVRLTAEWRQRVAGDAKPVSGPAMSLIADF